MKTTCAQLDCSEMYTQYTKQQSERERESTKKRTHDYKNISGVDRRAIKSGRYVQNTRGHPSDVDFVPFIRICYDI